MYKMVPLILEHEDPIIIPIIIPAICDGLWLRILDLIVANSDPRPIRNWWVVSLSLYAAYNLVAEQVHVGISRSSHNPCATIAQATLDWSSDSNSAHVRVRTHTAPRPICPSAAKSAPRVSVPPRPSTEDEPNLRSIVEGGCLRARYNV
ncbi:hypothetical protein CRG98_050009 [Punica granatum]|uniref:Uncharacterized protein n=1 Tax=Punica granatum TaxID=22663 RepID=A0A2I0H080_PUNGR|nr:hypothetical protein CRG98_050009 [Punica granatum]